MRACDVGVRGVVERGGGDATSGLRGDAVGGDDGSARVEFEAFAFVQLLLFTPTLVLRLRTTEDLVLHLVTSTTTRRNTNG